MHYSQQDFKRGDLVELHDSTEATIHNFHPNVLYIVISIPSKKKPYSIPVREIKKIISSPLPLQIGDLVIDSDRVPGVVIANTSNSLTIEKEEIITSHSFEKKLPKIKKLESTPPRSTRGGSRPNAGRPPSPNPPKKRKALQLDQAIAQSLPDLKMLHELIEQFRPIAESGALRSQKLADFYKKLDSLPKIVSENL
jgi:hypothetical protein